MNKQIMQHTNIDTATDIVAKQMSGLKIDCFRGISMYVKETAAAANNFNLHLEVTIVDRSAELFR